jgi:hypothetical protein
VRQNAPGWIRSTIDEPAVEEEGDARPRFTLTCLEPKEAELRLVASARPVTALPALVVSRLWIRTVQGPENQVRTTAWCWVESHEDWFSVALPRGAEWIRARVDGQTRKDLEPLAQSGEYQIRLPKRADSGPLLVELEYLIPARYAAGPWAPFRLLNGGLIQETLWEVRLPWNRSVIGVPRGWTDENEWYWDRYVWRRRPWKSAQALAAWVSGSAGRSSLSDAFDGEARTGYHSYMFGRIGAPTELRLSTASAGWLVAVCSGSALLLGGVFLIVVHPPYRLLAVSVGALAIALAAALYPSLTFLALQSGASGGVLVIIAFALQKFVERHRPAHSVFGPQNRLITAATAGSSLSRPVPGLSAGSDDSTAIRARPASTVDHGVPVRPPAPDTASGRASSPNLGGRSEQ